MSIESNHFCDVCQCSLSEGDEIVCLRCDESLKEEITALEREIEDLKSQLSSGEKK